MILSRKTKEAIKTALAMTIAYGIALSMGWDRPYWAGLAVTMVSLSTIGQSLNKGALRMLGTLLAFMMSLLIIALFVQDRWWFIVALSGWIGFCTYRMTVSRRSYFWFLAGFASAIIALDGGTDPANAFDTAILRCQETALGILVYTLITTLLWPNNSRAGFEDSTRALVQIQHQLYSGLMIGHTSEKNTPDQDTQEIADQQVQILAQFSSILDAALTDSYEVWELRDQWHHFQNQSIALHETLDRWNGSSKELDEIDLNTLLPKLNDVMMEFELRFAEIERLLAGEALKHQPQIIDLSIDHARVNDLSHFHKAAFMLARTGLQRLDGLTRNQLDTVIEIKGLGKAASISVPASVTPSKPPRHTLLPDFDGMIAAVRIISGLWLAYLLWIYIEIPNGNGVVSLVAPMGMMMATMPRVSPLIILKPALLTITFTGILYVFLMPQLSSFLGLGTMIFLVVFAIAYLFSTPKQGMIRSTALAFFVVTIGVSDQQHYNFVSVVDSALMSLIVIGVLVLTSRVPFSMQPDKAFLRLLQRFFRSSEYLMATMHLDQTVTLTRLDYWRRTFHLRELSTLPKTLSDWGKVIDTKVLSSTTPEQVQALTSNLQVLSYHIQETLDELDKPQSQLLMEELLTDFRPWRIGIQKSFRRLAKDSDAGEREVLANSLKGFMEQMELRIKEVLNKTAEGQFSDQDAENFYRLLAGYRGISEAMIGYAGNAGDIDWAIWHEERFS